MSGRGLIRGIVFEEVATCGRSGGADLGCQPGGHSGFQSAFAIVGQLEVGVSAAGLHFGLFFLVDFRLQHSGLTASAPEDESPPDVSSFPASSFVTFRKYSGIHEMHQLKMWKTLGLK